MGENKSGRCAEGGTEGLREGGRVMFVGWENFFSVCVCTWESKSGRCAFLSFYFPPRNVHSS